MKICDTLYAITAVIRLSSLLRNFTPSRTFSGPSTTSVGANTCSPLTCRYRSACIAWHPGHKSRHISWICRLQSSVTLLRRREHALPCSRQTAVSGRTKGNLETAMITSAISIPRTSFEEKIEVVGYKEEVKDKIVAWKSTSAGGKKGYRWCLQGSTQAFTFTFETRSKALAATLRRRQNMSMNSLGDFLDAWFVPIST